LGVLEDPAHRKLKVGTVIVAGSDWEGRSHLHQEDFAHFCKDVDRILANNARSHRVVESRDNRVQEGLGIAVVGREKVVEELQLVAADAQDERGSASTLCMGALVFCGMN